MVTVHVNLRELESDLARTTAIFGEANQTGIARWGVAVARRLVTVTQAWGDGKDARKKQENAMLKDANRAIFSVSKPSVVKALASGKMTGLVINGELVRFARHQLLNSPQAINDWIDVHRTSRKGRVPRMKPSLKGVGSERNLQAAMRVRYKRAGKAKGGWIGAGKKIGAFQKTGSRITIGKNVASYAHKFDHGGRASMTTSIWTPAGTITNHYSHVSNEHVLKASDITKAIIEGGNKTLKWYEKTTQARLNRRSR